MRPSCSMQWSFAAVIIKALPLPQIAGNGKTPRPLLKSISPRSPAPKRNPLTPPWPPSPTSWAICRTPTGRSQRPLFTGITRRERYYPVRTGLIQSKMSKVCPDMAQTKIHRQVYPKKWTIFISGKGCNGGGTWRSKKNGRPWLMERTSQPHPPRADGYRACHPGGSPPCGPQALGPVPRRGVDPLDRRRHKEGRGTDQ